MINLSRHRFGAFGVFAIAAGVAIAASSFTATAQPVTAPTPYVDPELRSFVQAMQQRMQKLNVVPGAYHGFDFVAPEAAITKRFHSALTDALKRAFTREATGP